MLAMSGVLPGDPRTLGYGTDQGRWLSEELRTRAASGEASTNRFRCVPQALDSAKGNFLHACSMS